MYPNSLLDKCREPLEALPLGALQMRAPSLASFGRLGLKNVAVPDLPFSVKDTPAFPAATPRPVGQALLARLESKGIIGLACWDNGFDLMSRTSHCTRWPTSKA